MASPASRTLTVPLALDAEGLVRQLEVLRTLASHIGFALDTAILALREPAPEPMTCENCGKTMAEHDALAHCWGPESKTFTSSGERPLPRPSTPDPLLTDRQADG